jgi:hypothetical protein
MRRAWWVNALLAAAVAGLGLWVFLKPRSDAPAERPLAAFKPETARAIRIERPGAAAIALEKRGEQWVLAEPLAARADPVRVQRLLAVAGARPTSRLAATGLERFELDRPAARLTIDGQSFDFGMVNPVSREQYVLTGGAVYTIALASGAAIPGSPGDLIDKRLLASGEVPVRVELAGFTVAREEAKWVLRPPGGDLSQDDLQRWVDAWRHASALRVEPFAKGMPLEAVRMQFRDGTALSLGILAREPELALLRPDEKLVYYVFKGSAQRLLSPPGAVRDEMKK